MGKPLFYRGEPVTVQGKGDGHVTWDTADTCGVEFDNPSIPTDSFPKSQVSTR